MKKKDDLIEFPFFAEEHDRETDSRDEVRLADWYQDTDEIDLDESLELSDEEIEETVEYFSDLEQDWPDRRIYQQMLAFLDEDGWRYQKLNHSPTVMMDVTGDESNWRFVARIHKRRNAFLCYSIFPINIPAPKRSRIAEFITRANYGLWFGNFEMDYNDGEIRFKTSIDFGMDNEMSTASFRSTVLSNVAVFDRYFSGLMQILSTDADPSVLIDEIEFDGEFTESDGEETHDIPTISASTVIN